MKLAKCVLRILAISLAVSAFACVVLIYWEKIEACHAFFIKKVKDCCPALSKGKCCRVPDEYADFADV